MGFTLDVDVKKVRKSKNVRSWSYHSKQVAWQHSANKDARFLSFLTFLNLE